MVSEVRFSTVSARNALRRVAPALMVVVGVTEAPALAAPSADAPTLTIRMPATSREVWDTALRYRKGLDALQASYRGQLNVAFALEAACAVEEGESCDDALLADALLCAQAVDADQAWTLFGPGFCQRPRPYARKPPQRQQERKT